MTHHRYTVILEPESEGGFSVYVPSLPGCASQGETLEDALANIREAIEAHLLGLQDDGVPIPEEHAILKEVDITA